MNCPHGCDEGFIVTGDTAIPCPCLGARRRAAPDYRGGYAPGGLTEHGRRRRAARRAGLASGRARRARSPKGPRVTRQAALALKYPVRRVSRQRFEERYRECCEKVWKIRFHQAGFLTAWELYQADRRLFDACGQDCLTTNAQRGAALANRGRARCRRSVQLTRRRLADMGLEAWHHVRRSGPRRIPGQLDCLRLRMVYRGIFRSKDCTPPSGAPSIPSGLDDGALTSKTKGLDCAASRQVPPIGGDRPTASASSEEIAAFHQLKLELGWMSTELELSPYLRQQRVDARYCTEMSAKADATAATTWRGER